MYRKWRESKGKDRKYIEIIRKQVLATKAEAERDGVKVPITLDEYCVRTQVPPTDDGSNLLYDDYYDDEDLRMMRMTTRTVAMTMMTLAQKTLDLASQ